jgi:hypothetical protein
MVSSSICMYLKANMNEVRELPPLETKTRIRSLCDLKRHRPRSWW